jgi:CRP-like cAMP-binding protein
MESVPSLKGLLLRYVHLFMIQVAATALADGRYDVNQRLARWLLMCHDRLGDELLLTHDFLALMLGVRRPSVTDALHVLEGHRLIKAERSRITVRDRRGLEGVAGDAYGAPEIEYWRLISGVS